jgi:predicted Zn-dependent protease
VGLAAPVAAAVIALSGCAHEKLYGEPVPDGCHADSARGSEACMGWWIDRTKMLDFPELHDVELSRYVDRVANRVAHASGDRRDWHVRIVDIADIQAEANIWTTVYVTRGALTRMRDEAELAGVLGHEIGHVMAGHLRDAIIENARGAREQSRDLDAQRDDELQADELAVEYVVRAGYDVLGVERMLRAFAAGDPADDPDRGGDPHPRWNPRIARVQAFAMHFHGGETNAAAYLRHVAGLVVGEDPRYDAVLGKTVVFAKLGIAIDLPPGYTAMAADSAVAVSFKDNNDVALRVMAARGEAAMKFGPDHAFVTVHVGDQLLLIDATGDDRANVVAKLRAAIRAPTTNELRELVPQRLDATAKRALWPAAPPDSTGPNLTWSTG